MSGSDLSQSERFFLLMAAHTVGEAEALGSDKQTGDGRVQSPLRHFLAACPRQLAEPL